MQLKYPRDAGFHREVKRRVAEGLLLSGSLALAMAGVGFAVQHDANHGA